MNKLATRAVNLILGIACFAMAAALQRKPPTVRQIATPATALLLPRDGQRAISLNASGTIQTELFNLRPTAGHMSADTPWFVGSAPPTWNYYNQSPYAQMEVLIRTILDARTSSFQQAGGESLFEIGPVLVATQSSKNLESISAILQAVRQSCDSQTPITMKDPAEFSILFFVNLRPLLQRLDVATKLHGNADDRSIVENLFQFIRPLAGVDKILNCTPIVGQTCGNLLVLWPPMKNETSLRGILDTLNRAADAPELQPIMLDPAIHFRELLTPEPHQPTTTVFFNIRSLARGLKARQPTMATRYEIRSYILSQVDKASWNEVEDGGIYPIGSVLAITQTRENIAIVQQLLRKLSDELQHETKERGPS